jgi:AhpD family alkylhydroperoxidase
MGKEDVTERMDEIFEYIVQFSQQFPEIAKQFTGLMGSVMESGALGAKEKELISLGIAVGLRCVPCIYAHTRAALAQGAGRAEILEAASVAVLMQGGPGMAHVAEVMKALDALGGGA